MTTENLQITKRKILKHSLRRDLNISKRDTVRHTTPFAPTGCGLEECLRIIPKSICQTKIHWKSAYGNGESTKGNLLEKRSQNDQGRSSSHSSCLSRRHAEVKPALHSDNSKRVEIWKVGSNDNKKLTLETKQYDISNEAVSPKNECYDSGVSDNQESLRITTNKASHLTSVTSRLPINVTKTTVAGSVDARSRLLTPAKQLTNSTARKLLPQVFLFQRNYSKTDAPKIYSKCQTSARAKISSTRVRCKTSLGFYPSAPEGRTTRATKSAGLPRQRADSDIDDAYLAGIAARLDTHLSENDICRFQSVLSSYDQVTRQRVIHYKSDNAIGSSLFFRACQLSRVPFATLILKGCSVDLEQTGLFVVIDDDGGDDSFQVTPLWHAAALGNLELVRLLTSSGANINATTSTGSSVVQASCCLPSIPVVAFLLAQGADIHTRTKHGVTCLMSAVSSVDLIKLLIHHGSKINEADEAGNTALHYATEIGRLDTVKVLVEAGGNPMTHNKAKSNIIQTAAKFGQRQILDYLLKVTTPSLEEIIDVLMVLGSVCILTNADYSSGCLYWHKAFELKRISKKESKTQFHQSVLSEFPARQKITTSDELMRNCNNHELLSMEALFIYERIMGANDENFLHLLMYKGALYADNKNFNMAMQLWKTAYKLRLDKCASIGFKCGYTDTSNRGITKTLIFLVKILHNICYESYHSTEDDGHSLEEVDVLESSIRNLFKMLCNHVSQVTEVLKQSKTGTGKTSVDFFDFLSKTCLFVFLVYLKLFPSALHSAEPSTNLQKLVRLNPRGLNNRGLLHLSLECHTILQVCHIDKAVALLQISPFDLAEILLVLGANPLSRDSQGNTVLHLAVHRHLQGGTLSTDSTRKLLRLGVHADQVNYNLQTALDLLPAGDSLLQVLQEASLKCLAARAVVRYGIPYTGEVPRCLYSFIELHAC